MKYVKKSIQDNETAVNTVRLTTVEHSSMIKLLNYRSLDLEARSRRKNLLFKGLCENASEDCISIIRDFIYTELDLDSDAMCIDRAHRIGKRGMRGISRRPIIVAFRDFQDTECIMNNASKLRGSRFGIDRDYPAEISSARKLLWNRLKDLKSQGKEVVLEYPARLVIGRKVVEDAFPDWYNVLRTKRVEPTISEEVKAANDRAEERRQNRSRSHEQFSEQANTTENRWPNTQSNPRSNLTDNAVNNLRNDNSSRTDSTGYNRIVNEQHRTDDDEDATFYSDYVNTRMRPPQHVAWGAGTSGVVRSASEGSGQPRLNEQEYPPLNRGATNMQFRDVRSFKHVQDQSLTDAHATNVKYVAGNVQKESLNSKNNGAGTSYRDNGERPGQRNSFGQNVNASGGGIGVNAGTDNPQNHTTTNERGYPELQPVNRTSRGVRMHLDLLC